MKRKYVAILRNCLIPKNWVKITRKHDGTLQVITLCKKSKGVHILSCRKNSSTFVHVGKPSIGFQHVPLSLSESDIKKLNIIGYIPHSSRKISEL